MRAMILAAGLGTRLRPLTDDRPKALVEVAGHALLEITFRRLRAFGVREVIVNVHHFPEMILDFLQSNGNFGMRVEVSPEDVLLDTGGGLKKAAWFFQEKENRDEPFLLHNVDVLSTIDFQRMLQFHRANEALATLAVQKRRTTRSLLFNEEDQLCGRRTSDGDAEMVRSVAHPQVKAFSGVHIISPELLSKVTEEGVFSIITSYLRLAGEGAKILGFPADEYYWRDLGKRENLVEAEADVKKGLIQV
jgi:mannose-1-phosphate guanylyltransferase